MAEMGTTEIRINNVGMRYQAAQGNEVHALTDVSLDIQKGEFVSLLGPSGCGKNKQVPLEIMKIKKEGRLARVEKMLDLVGLSAFGDHYPYQLSGGMQQRVAIARALAINPQILLMDEPFSALDEFTREKLHTDLLRIWAKTTKTIIFVTHNIAESVFLSDRVCVLSPHPGRLSAVVNVDLPRPRTNDMRTTPEFSSLVAQIRNSFEGV